MKTLRLFISSPGDVGREREMARRVIERVEARFAGRVRLEPYFWEHEPMRTTRGDFQAQIPEPADFDLFICVLWSRLGSRLHPGKYARADGTPYASGTEYEFESAVRSFEAKGRPDLLVYRRKETPLFQPEPRELLDERLRQWEALKGFCQRWFIDADEAVFRAAYNSYKNLAEFEEKLETHLVSIITERLGVAAAGEGGMPKRPPAWTTGSPYRGLQVFEFEHESIFFGRTRARDEVLGALRARWLEEQCPFVLILGASGSGKSSLLRAGVMPWLVRPGVIEGIGLWRWLVFRPAEATAGLLPGLAAALMRPTALPELGADGTDAGKLGAMLQQNPAGVALLLKEALSRAARETELKENLEKQPVTRLAVGLDQLEEIFTLSDRFSAESRQAFFHVVDALVRSGYVWVVATLRSDFFNRCEEVPELVGLKQGRGQYHLLAPTTVEISQLIRLPAEAAGVTFEDDPAKGRLEDVIRDAALTEPGALPLLEFALDELFRASADGNVLRHEHYEKLGGVMGALHQRAEDAWGRLNPEQQGALDRALRALVRLGEGDEEVAARRVADYDSLANEAGTKGLVDAFTEARLLVADVDSHSRRTVAVAHEALLRVWPRLVEWVQTNRDFLRVRGRVGQALARWQESDRDQDFLLPAGRPLAEATDLLEHHSSVLEAGERDFIIASHRKAEHATRRRRRITFGVITGLSGLCLVALALWREADQQRGTADMLRLLADRQTHLAHEQTLRARGTAARADFELARLYRNTDPGKMLAHLARALRTDPFYSPVREDLVLNLSLGGWHFQPIGPFHSEDLIESTIFSPDGQRILTVSQEARIWDVRTGLPIGRPLHQNDHVDFAVFSPDGRMIVTVSYDNTARIWDAQTGQPIGEPLHHDEIRSATFSPDGRLVLTASWDGTARIWDAQTCQPVGQPLRHGKSIQSAVFSPNGARILTVSGDGNAQIWDTASGRPQGDPLPDKGRSSLAKLSPDGRLISTVPRSDTMQICDAQTGEPIGLPLHHDKDIESAVFSPDSLRIVTISGDRTARIWDVQTGRLLGGPMYHEDTIGSVAFSPDGKKIVTASYDRTAKVWDAKTGKSIGSMEHADGVESAIFSPNGRLILTVSKDKTAWLWDIATDRPLGEPLRHDAEIQSAAFSPDGQLVLTMTWLNTARIWEVDTGQAVGLTLNNKGPVYSESAEFSPDGHQLLTGAGQNLAQLWDVQTGQPTGPPMKPEAVINSAHFSPDGRLGITASGDGSARIWDLRTGQPIGQPLRHGEHVKSAVFSHDGRTVATVASNISEKDSAQLWNAGTGDPIGLPMVHADYYIDSLAFSADDRLLLTAGSDMARLWDARTGRPIEITFHTDERSSCTSAAFSPDGRKVVASSSDHTARQWDTQSGLPIGKPLRHDGLHLSAIFSPDGQSIMTTTLESVWLWNAKTGLPSAQLIQEQDYTGGGSSAAFSPDGRKIAAWSYSSFAQLWDAQAMQAVGPLLRHGWGLETVSFSPDGGHVVTVTSGGHEVTIWDVAVDLQTNVPDWLPLLAESVGGECFDDHGVLVPSRRSILQLRKQLLALKGDDYWSRFGRWFFMRGPERTISPNSNVTVGELERLNEAAGKSAVPAQATAK